MDQISRGCSLQSGFAMMSANDVSSLNQQISSGECETSDFNVNWMPSQMSQFDPEAADTKLTILSWVDTFFASRFEDEYF
jgi:hypothetical protein